MTKLEKKLNKSKKHSNSKKRARDSSDSDINSDHERVYGSTGNQNTTDTCLKLEEPKGINLKSTDTHPSKSTKLALILAGLMKSQLKTPKQAK